MTKTSINQAKKLFSQWRQNRRHIREVAPPEVRKAALQIVEQFGSTIAKKELCLSSSNLSKWQKQQGGIRRRVQKIRKSSTSTMVPRFVEVSPATINPHMEQGLWLEWRRPDGASMKLGGVAKLEQIEKIAMQFFTIHERSHS
jgi:hypothetical protein